MRGLVLGPISSRAVHAFQFANGSLCRTAEQPDAGQQTAGQRRPGEERIDSEQRADVYVRQTFLTAGSEASNDGQVAYSIANTAYTVACDLTFCG